MARDGLTKRPWYRWSPGEFLTDPAVAAMTRRQRMEYREALDLSWLSETPGIATPDQWRKWLGYGVDAWGDSASTCKDGICMCFSEAFKPQPDGTWIQKRLREEYLHATRVSRQAADNVSKGRYGRTTDDLRPFYGKPTRVESRETTSLRSVVGTVFADANTPSTVVEDASRNGRVKPKTQTPEEREWQDTFLGWFWLKYPRHVGKQPALRAFMKITPMNQATVNAMDQGLDRSLAEWSGRDQDKIPHATTWLNQRRWEDQ